MEHKQTHSAVNRLLIKHTITQHNRPNIYIYIYFFFLDGADMTGTQADTFCCQ